MLATVYPCPPALCACRSSRVKAPFSSWHRSFGSLPCGRDGAHRGPSEKVGRNRFSRVVPRGTVRALVARPDARSGGNRRRPTPNSQPTGRANGYEIVPREWASSSRAANPRADNCFPTGTEREPRGRLTTPGLSKHSAEYDFVALRDRVQQRPTPPAVSFEVHFLWKLGKLVPDRGYLIFLSALEW